MSNKSSGIPARQQAIWLLNAVIGAHKLIPEMTEHDAMRRLSPQNRARAQRLAETTLRGVDRADLLLKPYLSKEPPLGIQNILRLGVVELSFGAAAHGVINDLVQIAGRDRRYGRLKGLVNAVLRKVAPSCAAQWESLPVPRLPRSRPTATSGPSPFSPDISRRPDRGRKPLP